MVKTFLDEYQQRQSQRPVRIEGSKKCPAPLGAHFEGLEQKRLLLRVDPRPGVLDLESNAHGAGGRAVRRRRASEGDGFLADAAQGDAPLARELDGVPVGPSQKRQPCQSVQVSYANIVVEESGDGALLAWRKGTDMALMQQEREAGRSSRQ